MSTKYPAQSAFFSKKRTPLNYTFSQNSSQPTPHRSPNNAYSLRTLSESTKQTDPTTLALKRSSWALSVWVITGRRLKAETTCWTCCGVTACCDQQRTSATPPSPSFQGSPPGLACRSLLKSTSVSSSLLRQKKLQASSSINLSFYSSSFFDWADGEEDCLVCCSSSFFLRNRLEIIPLRNDSVICGCLCARRSSLRAIIQQCYTQSRCYSSRNQESTRRTFRLACRISPVSSYFRREGLFSVQMRCLRASICFLQESLLHHRPPASVIRPPMVTAIFRTGPLATRERGYMSIPVASVAYMVRWQSADCCSSNFKLSSVISRRASCALLASTSQNRSQVVEEQQCSAWSQKKNSSLCMMMAEMGICIQRVILCG